ncbi:uncharacterized protein LOC127844067 isoform X2 [Dreissena polymorpha]|uniref:uncharacterized protein LOC127844067 isoform X2 n=1 Tax=Dreissena polymorpha TaxID=45954 RepID=UPI002263FF0A|nr:uncharacterized protein LOC127844067 isoform X2 [Dreissena polymorpha]
MATRQPLLMTPEAGLNHRPATAGQFRVNWPDFVLIERPSSAPAINISNKLNSLKRSMTVLPNRTMFVQPRQDINSLSKNVSTFFNSKAQSLPVINEAFPKSKPLSLSVTKLMDILPSMDRAAVWLNNPEKSPVISSPQNTIADPCTMCEGQTLLQKSDSEITRVSESSKVVQEVTPRYEVSTEFSMVVQEVTPIYEVSTESSKVVQEVTPRYEIPTEFSKVVQEVKPRYEVSTLVQEGTPRYEVSTLRAIASKVVEALPAPTSREDIIKPDSPSTHTTASPAMSDTTIDCDVDSGHETESPNKAARSQQVADTPRYNVSALRSLALNVVKMLPNPNALLQTLETSFPLAAHSVEFNKQTSSQAATDIKSETTLSPTVSESLHNTPEAPRYGVSTLSALALKVVDTLPKPACYTGSLAASDTTEVGQTAIDKDGETTLSRSASESSQDVTATPRYEVSTLKAIALKVVDTLLKPITSMGSLAASDTKDDEKTSPVDAIGPVCTTVLSPSSSECSRGVIASPGYEVSTLMTFALTAADSLPTPCVDAGGASVTKEVTETAIDNYGETTVSRSASESSQDVTATPRYEVSTLKAIALKVVDTLPKPITSMGSLAASETKDDEKTSPVYAIATVGKTSVSPSSSECSRGVIASPGYEVSTLMTLALKAADSLPTPCVDAGGASETKEVTEFVENDSDKRLAANAPSNSFWNCEDENASSRKDVSPLRELKFDIVQSLPKTIPSIGETDVALLPNDSIPSPISTDNLVRNKEDQRKITTALQDLSLRRQTAFREISAAQESNCHTRDFYAEVRFLDSIEAECRKNNNKEVETVWYKKKLKGAKQSREEAAGKLMIINHKIIVGKQTYLASEQEILRAQILHLDAEIAVLEDAMSAKESVPTSRTSRQPKPPEIEPRMTRTVLRLQREKSLMVKAELEKERLMKLKFDQIRKEMEEKHLKNKSLRDPKSIFNVPKKKECNLSEKDKKRNTLTRPSHDAGMQKSPQKQAPFKKTIVRTCSIKDRVIKANPLPAFYHKASALPPIATKNTCLDSLTRDETAASNTKKSAPVNPVIRSARNVTSGDFVKDDGGYTSSVVDNNHRDRKSTGNDVCVASSENHPETVNDSENRVQPPITSGEQRTAEGRVKSRDQPTAKGRMKVRKKKERVRTCPIRDRVIKANPLPAFYNKASALSPIPANTKIHRRAPTRDQGEPSRDQTEPSRDQAEPPNTKLTAPLPPIVRSANKASSVGLRKGDCGNTWSVAGDKQLNRKDKVNDPGLTTSLCGPETLARGRQRVLPPINSRDQLVTEGVRNEVGSPRMASRSSKKLPPIKASQSSRTGDRMTARTRRAARTKDSTIRTGKDNRSGYKNNAK